MPTLGHIRGRGPQKNAQAKPNAVYSGKDGESDSERKISESQPFDWEPKRKRELTGGKMKMCARIVGTQLPCGV